MLCTAWSMLHQSNTQASGWHTIQRFTSALPLGIFSLIFWLGRKHWRSKDCHSVITGSVDTVGKSAGKGSWGAIGRGEFLWWLSANVILQAFDSYLLVFCAYSLLSESESETLPYPIHSLHSLSLSLPLSLHLPLPIALIFFDTSSPFRLCRVFPLWGWLL